MRNNLSFLVSVLVLSSLALTGCGGLSDISLDESDDGSRITLQAGQALSVNLEGNPTTGFTWEVAEMDATVLRQIGEVEFDPASGLVGSSGIQTLNFEAAASGETTLRLVYHRPWEEDVEPIESFSVHVTVR